MRLENLLRFLTHEENYIVFLAIAQLAPSFLKFMAVTKIFEKLQRKRRETKS